MKTTLIGGVGHLVTMDLPDGTEESIWTGHNGEALRYVRSGHTCSEASPLIEAFFYLEGLPNEEGDALVRELLSVEGREVAAC